MKGLAALLAGVDAETYEAVVGRLSEADQLLYLAEARGPLDVMLRRELAVPDPRRLAALASNGSLSDEHVEALAALAVPEIDGVLVCRSDVGAEFRAALLGRLADAWGAHSAALRDVLRRLHETRAAGLRHTLAVADARVCALLLPWAGVWRAEHDAVVLGAALRVARELGAEVLGAAVTAEPGGLAGLGPYRRPQGTGWGERWMAVLERSAAESAGRMPVLAEYRFDPAAEEVRAALEIDWAAVLRGHEATPLSASACAALLARAPGDVRDRLFAAFRDVPGAFDAFAFGLPPAELVQRWAPAWQLLAEVDRHVEFMGPSRMISAKRIAHMTLGPGLLEVLGDDPEAWLRMLRAGPGFAGTLPELLELVSGADALPVVAHADEAFGGAAASLLLSLAPEPVAKDVLAALPSGAGSARRTGIRPGKALARADGEALQSRDHALAWLADEPALLQHQARFPAAYHAGLIDAADVLRHGRPALRVLTVPVPGLRDALAALARDTLSSPDTAEAWLVLRHLLPDFPGTVVELLATAAAATR